MNIETIFYDDLATPVGRLRLVADATGLRGVWFDRGRHQHQEVQPEWQHSPAVLAFATDQINAYFAGTRQSFDLPLNPVGTAFQLAVWNELKRIPYGATISYGELARRIGKPTAVRAVGAANGRNPLSIVVPCHRVIGAKGELTGFAGGVENKRELLALEQRAAGHKQKFLLSD